MNEELPDHESADKPARPYRPSNGTEGDIFEARFCRRCSREDMRPDEETGLPRKSCSILGDVYFASIDDPEYPKAWTYDADGDPVCTSFRLSASLARLQRKAERYDRLERDPATGRPVIK